MKQPHPSDWIDREDYRKQILASQEDVNSDENYLQIVEIKPGNHVKPHAHETTQEVFYILQAGGTLIINGDEREPEKGDVIICEPGDVHEVINRSSQTFRILVFKMFYEEDDTVWLEE